MKFWHFPDISLLYKIRSLKSFGSSWDNSYIPFLLLIITLCFTCGESKIWENIKKSQNFMKMIVGPDFKQVSNAYISKTWNYKFTKKWFLDDFSFVFRTLSNGIVGFDFFWLWFFADNKIFWHLRKPFQNPKTSHPHFLVYCSHQKTDSIIKWLLTSESPKNRFNNKIAFNKCVHTGWENVLHYYKQLDDVTMGSPLGPVLATIFMCSFEYR